MAMSEKEVELRNKIFDIEVEYEKKKEELKKKCSIPENKSLDWNDPRYKEIRDQYRRDWLKTIEDFNKENGTDIKLPISEDEMELRMNLLALAGEYVKKEEELRKKYPPPKRAGMDWDWHDPRHIELKAQYKKDWEKMVDDFNKEHGTNIYIGF